MSFNLLETVKGFFSPNLISNAATTLGESESGIQKALTGAIPSILAGLIGKADTHEGAADVLDLAKNAAGSGILNNLGGFLSDDNNNLLSKGAEMLKGALGDKAGGIASLVSNFAGIKHSSASSILSIAAPAALGVLGTHAAESNLNAGGLMSFLSSQKSTILNALPSGLSSIAGVLGLGTAGSAVSSATSHTTHAAHTTSYADDTTETTNGGLKFLLPLLLGILAVALSIYLFKGCSGAPVKDITVADTTAAKPADTSASTAVTAARELFKVKLPNDTVIDAYKGGIEDKLVTFLKSDYKKLGEDSLKKVWFDFDNLNFETGSAKITAESQKQIDNIASILRAFPDAKLKIGGYTDKTGDEAVNKKLSDGRAKAVLAALDKAGVGKQITGAEGYGSSFAVYDAKAPESDRVKDRHVSVSVR